MANNILDPNKVFINEFDIIEIHVVGDQTPESIELMSEAAKKFLATGAKKLILDDVRRMGDVDKAGRQVVVEYGRILSYDKLALLGTSGMLQFGANLMMQAIGKGNKVQYFVDRDKAIGWLLAQK